MNLIPDIDLISPVLIFLSLWVLSNFFFTFGSNSQMVWKNLGAELMKYPCFPGSVLKTDNLTLSLVINLPLPHAIFLTRSFFTNSKYRNNELAIFYLLLDQCIEKYTKSEKQHQCFMKEKMWYDIVSFTSSTKKRKEEILLQDFVEA